MRHLALLVAVVLATSAADAQPAPNLGGVTPIYLKQGQSLDVTLGGTNLGGASQVFLTDATGLSAELIADKAADPKKPVNAVKVKLTAAADADLGVRELRVATPNGVTRPIPVTVGQFAATADTEPNNSAKEAQSLSFPTSIVGRIDVGGDMDDFRFDAKKGQTLIFDVHATRLGSALQPVIAILDAAGREMPRRISHRQPAITADADPSVIFDVPADGVYTLHVRDMQYRGGATYTYRIDAGEIPFVEAVLPASGRKGESVQVTAIGYNLGKNATQTVDLGARASSPASVQGTPAAAAAGEDARAPRLDDRGEFPLRFKTPVGWSNAIPFAVTDAAPVAEKPSNNSAEKAMPVSVPAEVSGVLTKSAEEDFYRITVPTKQPITIEVTARVDGSPVDALLTLRDPKGAVLDQNNGAGESEARISRSFDPGDYIISIRDLTFAGSPSHRYRLGFVQAAAAPADFAVRFMPDDPRISRGGHAKLWCEVVRLNGYKGDVALSFDGLPTGVTVSGGPAVIGAQTSGIFTISATPEAALGNFPIRLKAEGTAGAQLAVRYGQAEDNGRNVQGAYLTVLPQAPLAVESLAQISPQQLAAYPEQVQAIYARLNAPSPEIDKAQAAWEKKYEGAQQWQTVEVTSTESAGGAELKKQPDGSILQSGKTPEKDTFTIIGTANLKQITAVKLEVLPDPSLPSNGPGRSSGGNFVLHTFAVSIASKADPKNTKPIPFTSAKATFEQDGYAVLGAANNNLQDGWAIFGGTGKPQTAWFFPEEPIAAGDVIVTTSMIQYYGEAHTIGRFRLSLTDDPNVKQQQTEPPPAAVAGALKTPADKRTDAQKAQLSAYYRSIAPELQSDRAKLEALKSSIGPMAEVARLEAALAAGSPALDAERREWEQTVAAGFAWTPLDVSSARGTGGTTLTREKDGSLVAGGAPVANESYVIAARSSLKAITAIRLETLPDERFQLNGPGQNKGNFVLTKVDVAVPGGKPGETLPVKLRDARATFEQNGYGVAGVLDENSETGWAIAPLSGYAHSATLFPKTPIVAAADGLALNLNLEFNHPKHKAFTLGRFRLWALGTAEPSAATSSVPGNIADILKVAEDKRNPAQKDEIAAYFRSIAPSLEPTRQRLAELKSKLPEYPISIVRNRTTTIPVPISRTGAFAGPVKVTLEGFSTGRDPATRMPTPITKNFDVTPLTLTPDQSFAKLTIKPKNNSELGTRMVVLRAEATVGSDTYVQYSQAFPITVLEK